MLILLPPQLLSAEGARWQKAYGQSRLGEKPVCSLPLPLPPKQGTNSICQGVSSCRRQLAVFVVARGGGGKIIIYVQLDDPEIVFSSIGARRPHRGAPV